MLIIVLIACIMGAIGLLVYLQRKHKFSKLPPGPKGLPFVGNAFQQDLERPHITWFTWAEKYGKLFTIWNFGKPTVLCNDFDILWEILVTKSADFAGRPQQYVMKYCSDDGNDVGLGDFNPGWARRKKIFIASLKMYGEGIKRLEDLMVDIIDELVEDMESFKGQPFDPRKYLELTLNNTLSLLLLGTKFEHNEQDFNELVEHAAQSREVFSQSLQTFAYDAFPWLHYLPLPFSRVIDQYVGGFMKGWVPRHVQKVRVNYDSDNCVCVMDAFLKQHEQDLVTGAEFPLEERHVVALSAGFIVAVVSLNGLEDVEFDVISSGLNTSTPALTALFGILTAKPEIQAKAREEVDHIIQGQRPTLKDRWSMPYIQAMLEEVFRYVVIIPALPHKTMKDLTLHGYFLPKDTEVLPNMWFLCHDSQFWKEPYAFKPERFLDSNGALLPLDHPKRTRVLAFGAGRRVCPGEQLARNRIFLITTSLLQKFIFIPASKNELPKYDPSTFKLGISLMPQPYKLRAVPRN